MRRAAGWQAIRNTIGFVSVLSTTAVFAPGAALVAGSRLVVARAYRLKAQRLRLLATTGGRLEIAQPLRRAQVIALALIPPAAALLFGFAILLPPLVDMAKLGVPVREYLPFLGLGNDTRSAIANLTSNFGLWVAIRLWIGASCWFCSLPHPGDLQAVALAVSEAREKEPAVDVTLWLLALLFWFAKKFNEWDEFAKWFFQVIGGVVWSTALFGLSILVLRYLI